MQLLFACCIAYALFNPVRGGLVNITVDDSTQDGMNSSLPSIAYAPPGVWSFGPTCEVCEAKPDAAKTFGGTWHDTMFIPTTEANQTQTATLMFTGSALYVYCILSPTEGTLDGDMHLEFFIDGQRTGSFDIAGKSDYQYNVPVYVNTSLETSPHNFTLQNGATDNQTSLILLDYMIYSVDSDMLPSGVSPQDPSPIPAPSSARSSHGRSRIIVASVVCSVLGIVMLTAVAGTTIYRHRRRLNKERDEMYSSLPYELSGTSIQPAIPSQCKEQVPCGEDSQPSQHSATTTPDGATSPPPRDLSSVPNDTTLPPPSYETALSSPIVQMA